MSEVVGRKWPLVIAVFGQGIFTIACAVTKDVQTLIICRFFAGVCGASQLTVVPGLLSDLYDNAYRGLAIALYALTVFGAPFIAPIASGYTASSYLGWRWTLHIYPGFSRLSKRRTYSPLLEGVIPLVLCPHRKSCAHSKEIRKLGHSLQARRV